MRECVGIAHRDALPHFTTVPSRAGPTPRQASRGSAGFDACGGVPVPWARIPPVVGCGVGTMSLPGAGAPIEQARLFLPEPGTCTSHFPGSVRCDAHAATCSHGDRRAAKMAESVLGLILSRSCRLPCGPEGHLQKFSRFTRFGAEGGFRVQGGTGVLPSRVKDRIPEIRHPPRPICTGALWQMMRVCIILRSHPLRGRFPAVRAPPAGHKRMMTAAARTRPRGGDPTDACPGTCFRSSAPSVFQRIPRPLLGARTGTHSLPQ